MALSGPRGDRKEKGFPRGECLSPSSFDQNHRVVGRRVSRELSATCPANPTGEGKMGWSTHDCVYLETFQKELPQTDLAETSTEQN